MYITCLIVVIKIVHVYTLHLRKKNFGELVPTANLSLLLPDSGTQGRVSQQYPYSLVDVVSSPNPHSKGGVI